MGKNSVCITDFGAVAGCEALQTKFIQAAIDHCFGLGGGVVEVPAGVFHTGDIRLRSNITLHLLQGAVLKGSRNPEDYFSYVNDQVEPLGDLITGACWNRPATGKRDYTFMRTAGSRWNNGLIRAIHAENVAIIGEEGSVIDGSDCFDELGEERYRGPHLISMWYCRNVVFRGYTAKDSANWAHSTFYCTNVLMEDVTVLAGHDGIHMTVCNNVRVEKCKFYTGDDCVAGIANVNVTVTDCEINSACSAMRFGGTNVLVEKCHIYGPCKYLFRGSLTPEEKRSGVKPSLEGHRNNMLSVYTYYSDFSLTIPYQPGNIIIQDCTVDFADRFLHYNFSGNETWQKNRPLESIKFENIKATDISMPLTAYGDPEIPVTLELKNVDISMRPGFETVDFMHVAHYKKITLDHVALHNHRGSHLIKDWTGGVTEFLDVTCGVEEENYVQRTEEPFVCQPI